MGLGVSEMKAIMISIRPRHACNILNLIKLWEIRKKFPKDYVGWVYIYCTKDKNNLLHKNCADIWWVEDKDFQKKNKRLGIEQQPIYNGKVVGRFWCDKVEDVKFNMDYVFGGLYNIKSYSNERCFERDCCLSQTELDNYLNKNNNKRDKVGAAIHVTKVEPFDKPKEIKEFMKTLDNFDGINCWRCPNRHNCSFNVNKKCEKLKLTRAPQSWCYIEV